MKQDAGTVPAAVSDRAEVYSVNTRLMAITVFAATLAAAAPAWAQRSMDDVRKNSAMHFGALYLTPKFEIRDLGVDTNVFSTAANPKSDFTLTLRPSSDFGVPMARKALLAGNAGVDAVYYKKFSSERSVNPSVDARLEYFSPRVTLFTDGGILSSRQRQNLEIDLRSRRTERRIAGGFDVRVSGRSIIRFAAEKSAQRYDADAVYLGSSLHEQLDRNTITYSATLRSQRTQKTLLFLETSVAHDRFLLNNRRDADSVRILPGAELAPRALINGKIKMGFRRMAPRDNSIKTFTGLVANADLGYTLHGATRFGLSLDRDVDFSYDRSQTYYVKNGWGTSVRQQVFGDADVVLSWQQHRYNYQQSTSRNQPSEFTKNFGVDAGYRLNRTVRLGLGINHWTRTSDLSSSRAYDGWRYGVSITYVQ